MNFAIATASGSASIRYGGPEWPLAGTVFENRPAIKPWAATVPAASAAWLQVVEGRIVGSIEPEEGLADGSGEYISRDIGERAIEFFRCASDVLPAEPYVYSSTMGDLVAEFELAIGNRLTVIVGSERILAYAVSGDKTDQRQVDTTGRDYRSARAAVESLMDRLATA